MNNDAKISLNIFSKHDIEALAYLLKESLQDQSCAQSMRVSHLSLSRSWFVVDRYTSY